jgi:hypothetical protein
VVKAKTILPLLFLFFNLTSLSQALSGRKIPSPLTSFSIEWDKDIYAKCNTAKDANYLTALEKDVIWILNLARTNPQLFLNTVLLDSKSEYYSAPESRNNYKQSLIRDLKKMKPAASLIQPDQSLFSSAACHAFNSGKTGYVGHERNWKDCKWSASAECCSYGFEDPLDIVMQLLIDDGVPSLGHREICLSYAYGQIGVSIQPHSVWRYNCVLDFR